MDFEQLKQLMAENAARIRLLVQGVSEQQARWKPDPESWSVLEVINHLYDEEREDFRVRLDIILHQPDQPWPPINPDGWVQERRYNERDLDKSLSNFLEERRASLEWLESLSAPDWEASYEASFGTMRAGDMFASWVTHDQLHLRQLVELHRAWLERLVEPYDLRYGGEW
jgi:hypothetical protein